MTKNYNPSNPAFDACAGTEAIINRMTPIKLEADATKGMLSKRTPSVKDAMQEGSESIAEYVKIVRDIMKENMENA